MLFLFFTQGICESRMLNVSVEPGATKKRNKYFPGMAQRSDSYATKKQNKTN